MTNCITTGTGRMRIIKEGAQSFNISAELLKKWPDDVFIFDASAAVPSGVPIDRCIGVCSGHSAKQIVEIAHRTGCKHIVQTSSQALEKEINCAAQMIVRGTGFLDDPLSALLSQPAREVMEFEFRNSAEKLKAITSVNQFLEQKASGASFCDHILTIADELFTNAIFDAPTDDRGEHPYRKMQRNAQVAYASHHPSSKLFLTMQDDRAIIGCRDSFGSLDVARVLERLVEIYSKGVAASINMGPGGAGIGLRMVFDFSSSFYIGVEKGRRTVVCACVPTVRSAKERAAIGRNLHLQTV